MRENAEAKSKRLLVDGHVQIVSAGSRGIRAVVVGDHDSYEVRMTPTGRTNCECPSRAPCSHVMAVGLVTRQGGGR